MIACVSCSKSARWDIFALFWLLATLRIEAYSDFPDSLYKRNSANFAITEFSEVAWSPAKRSFQNPPNNPYSKRTGSRVMLIHACAMMPCVGRSWAQSTDARR